MEYTNPVYTATRLLDLLNKSYDGEFNKLYKDSAVSILSDDDGKLVCVLDQSIKPTFIDKNAIKVTLQGEKLVFEFRKFTKKVFGVDIELGSEFRFVVNISRFIKSGYRLENVDVFDNNVFMQFIKVLHPDDDVKTFIG